MSLKDVRILVAEMCEQVPVAKEADRIKVAN